MRCCFRRDARGGTCSAITPSAAIASRPRCAQCRWGRTSMAMPRVLGLAGGARRKEPKLLASYDPGLMWVTLVLLTVGIVMVYSASIATAEAGRFTGYRGTYFLARHAVFAWMG